MQKIDLYQAHAKLIFEIWVLDRVVQIQRCTLIGAKFLMLEAKSFWNEA